MSNAFSNRIGVTIEEGITNAVSIGSNVSTRNIGLLVERERGVAGKAILVNTLKEDRKIFGAHRKDMYSSYVVENLFNNSGGYPVNLYQSRIVGAGTLPAVATLSIDSEEVAKIYAGSFGEKDAGNWGNDLKVRVYAVATNNNPNGTMMEVTYKGYIVERYFARADDADGYLSSGHFDVMEQANKLSQYIMCEILETEDTVVDVTYDLTLTGGVYISPTDAEMTPSYDVVTGEPKGMATFDSVDVQIIACPEVFSIAFARACEDFCRVNLKHFIFNMPYLATEDVVASYTADLMTPDQSFASAYLEWCEVPADLDGNKIWIPQIGYVLGAGYIRKAGLNNGDVWTPPAGVETNSKSIYKFTHQDLNNDKKSRYVKVHKCNVVEYVNNVGFCIWSSRTYSTSELFESIHVRLETNWLLKNIENRNKKFMQRIISPSMQKSIQADNLIWFKNLYERGGIEQSVAFSDAVMVTVTQSKENRKEVEMDIAWIPPECLEHIHIKLNRNDGVLITNF